MQKCCTYKSNTFTVCTLHRKLSCPAHGYLTISVKCPVTQKFQLKFSVHMEILHTVLGSWKALAVFSSTTGVVIIRLVPFSERTFTAGQRISKIIFNLLGPVPLVFSNFVSICRQSIWSEACQHSASPCGVIHSSTLDFQPILWVPNQYFVFGFQYFGSVLRVLRVRFGNSIDILITILLITK